MRWRRSGDDAQQIVEIVGEAMTMADDVEAADRVVAALGRALRADAAAIGFIRGNELHVFGMWNYTPDMRVHALAPGEGLSGQAWTAGKPIVVDDIRRTASYVAGTDGISSGAYVPGRVAGQVAAVLCVESARPRAYGVRDLPLLQAVADLVAAMILSRRQARDAAALEDRPLPLIGREIRPALDRVRERIDVALDAAPTERAAAIGAAHRSAVRVEQLLDSLFEATRVTATVTVHPRDLPLQRVVRTAVQAAGAGPHVDVSVPALLRVTADEALLVQALRELLAETGTGADDRAAIVATAVADEVALHLRVPDPGPLRRHVAARLIEAMSGRTDASWPAGATIMLRPGRSDMATPSQRSGEGR